MIPMKHFLFIRVGFTFSLIFVQLNLIAQLLTYDSSAFHYRIAGAKEQFDYRLGDTLKIPVGQYFWSIKRETDSIGHYELALLKTQFANGLPHGAVEMAIYLISFDINEFDMAHINPHTYGDRFHVKGKYEKGKPVGIWVMEKNEYQSDQIADILTFNAQTSQWTFKRDELGFSGKIDPNGYFVGKWVWNLEKDKKLESHYNRGILHELLINGQPDGSPDFNYVKSHLGKLDSIIDNPGNQSWIWENGMDNNHPNKTAQQPLEAMMNQAYFTFGTIAHWLGNHPLLTVPVIKGTRQMYFKLRDTDIKLAHIRISQLDKLDSILAEKVSLPIFQLRRDQNDHLDSLLLTAEMLLREIQGFSNQTRVFLSPASRTILPELLTYGGKSNFSSHAAYLRQLLSQGVGISKAVEQKIVELEKTESLLREEGAVADLEQEWFYIHDMLVKIFKPNEDTTWYGYAFDALLIDDFEERKKAYGLLPTVVSQKEFLLKEVEWVQFLLDFYKNKTYLELTDIEDDLLKVYTKMLYNPYMGINNVELIVKKRFLERLTKEFWPFMIHQMKSFETRDQFKAGVFKLMNYKVKMLEFAEDKSAAAKKLDRKVRAVKSMEEMDRLIMDFLQEGR